MASMGVRVTAVLRRLMQTRRWLEVGGVVDVHHMACRCLVVQGTLCWGLPEGRPLRRRAEAAQAAAGSLQAAQLPPGLRLQVPVAAAWLWTLPMALSHWEQVLEVSTAHRQPGSCLPVPRSGAAAAPLAWTHSKALPHWEQVLLATVAGATLRGLWALAGAAAKPSGPAAVGNCLLQQCAWPCAGPLLRGALLQPAMHEGDGVGTRYT